MDKEKYIRVGTSYLKRCKIPMSSGGHRVSYIPWNIETLRQDHSKDFISKIEKYDGFCVRPGHTDYQKSIDGFMNLYEELAYVPAQGEFPRIRAFLGHVFGEQIEMGLDYLQLLYSRPRQRLPILLLVSKERNTGKTTFLHFLQAIFGGNMTINTTFDIRSGRIFLVFCFMGIILIALAIILNHKAQTIKQLNDNDLKYRYIQMKGQAAPEDILLLREVFDYNRNADSIRVIKGRVEKYEQLIREESERQARARLNAAEAERLRHEAETVRDRK